MNSIDQINKDEDKGARYLAKTLKAMGYENATVTRYHNPDCDGYEPYDVLFTVNGHTYKGENKVRYCGYDDYQDLMHTMNKIERPEEDRADVTFLYYPESDKTAIITTKRLQNFIQSVSGRPDTWKYIRTVKVKKTERDPDSEYIEQLKVFIPKDRFNRIIDVDFNGDEE